MQQVDQDLSSSILSTIFNNGFTVRMNEKDFRNKVVGYFRNPKKSKHIYAQWKDLDYDLTLRYDDRLNIFFLCNGQKPVLGMYLFKESSLQIIPFRGSHLDLGVILVLDMIKQQKIKFSLNAF